MEKLYMAEMDRNNKNGRLFTLIFVVIVLGIFVWRLFFSVDVTDEAYYTALPYRLAQGDMPLVEAQEMHQLCGLLYAPIIKLYTIITGGTQGIILFARFWFLLISLGVSTVFIWAVRKAVSVRMASVLAVIIVISMPLWHYSISYNNTVVILGILCSALVYALLFTNIPRRKTPLLVLLAGSQVMMCMAHVGGIFACIYLIAVTVAGLVIKYRNTDKLKKYLPVYIFSGIGFGLLLLLFLMLYVGTERFMSSVSNILSNPIYGGILTSSDTGNSISFFEWIQSNLPFRWVLAGIYIFILSTFRKYSRQLRWVYFVLVVFQTLAMTVSIMVNAAVLPFMLQSRLVFALAALAPLFLLLLKGNSFKKYLYLFIAFAGVSLLLYFGISRFSFNGFKTSHFLLLGMCITSLIGFGFWFSELFSEKKYCVRKYLPIAPAVAFCAVFLACTFMGGARERPSVTTTQMQSGPYAGIYTMPETAEQLYELEHSLSSIDNGDASLLCLEVPTVGYLMTDMKACTPDVYRATYYSVRPSDYSDSVAALFKYFDTVSGLPDYIVCFIGNMKIDSSASIQYLWNTCHLYDEDYPIHRLLVRNYSIIYESDNYFIYQKASDDFVYKDDNGNYIDSAEMFAELNPPIEHILNEDERG